MHQSRRARLIRAALFSGLVAAAHAAQANDLTLAPQPGELADLMKGAMSPDEPGAEHAYPLDGLDAANFDVWERIRRGFAIPDLNNPLVSTHVTWYSSRPEYIRRTTQRASRYLFFVVQELKRTEQVVIDYLNEKLKD